MCKLFRCSILQLPKQNKALLWWDDAHAEESGEATAIAEERKNGRVLRANGGIRFSNVIDFDWPQKFQDIDIEYVSHFRDHFLGNCLFPCQTLKSRIKQAYFPADDWYHQHRVYPFVICISNWFWETCTDQTPYTWDLILCPHIGTCVAGMPWCSSNMVLTSRTWLRMATQSRPPVFFCHSGRSAALCPQSLKVSPETIQGSKILMMFLCFLFVETKIKQLPSLIHFWQMLVAAWL